MDALQTGNGEPPEDRLPFNTGGLIGPFFIGGVLGASLAGATILSTGLYYFYFPLDRWFYKLSVGGLCGASITNLGLAMYLLYWFGVTTRYSDEMLEGSSLVVFGPLFTLPVSSFISQTFFSVRAYKLLQKRIVVAIPLGILVLGNFGVGFALIVQSSIANIPLLPNTDFFDAHTQKVAARIVYLGAAYFWIATGTDIIVTGLLIIKLTMFYIEAKDYGNNTKLITRVLRLSLISGAVSTIPASAVAIVVHMSSADNNAGHAFIMVMPHLYALVVIGSLCIRNHPGGDPWSTNRQGSGKRRWSTSAQNKDSFGAMSRPGVYPYPKQQSQVGSRVHADEQEFDGARDNKLSDHQSQLLTELGLIPPPPSGDPSRPSFDSNAHRISFPYEKAYSFPDSYEPVRRYRRGSEASSSMSTGRVLLSSRTPPQTPNHHYQTYSPAPSTSPFRMTPSKAYP